MRPLDTACLRRMSYGGMRRYADTLDLTVCSDLLPGSRQGCYDEETRTIIVDRSMTYRQKRCTLVHELVHWSYADDACNPSYHTYAEIRTRRQTALILIDPQAYVMAELAYEGEPYAMACELDVTLQILHDYRRLILEKCQVAGCVMLRTLERD